MSPVAAFEFTLLLLVAVLGLELLAKVLRLPPAAALIAGGIVLAFVPGFPTVSLDPQLVLVLFLPPLLMDGAYFTAWADFRRNLGGICCWLSAASSHQGSSGRGAVAGGAGGHALFDSADGQRLGVARPRGSLDLLAGLGGGHLLDWPKLRLGHRPQYLPDLRMKVWQDVRPSWSLVFSLSLLQSITAVTAVKSFTEYAARVPAPLSGV
jgi:hypothetical protein